MASTLFKDTDTAQVPKKKRKYSIPYTFNGWFLHL